MKTAATTRTKLNPNDLGYIESSREQCDRSLRRFVERAFPLVDPKGRFVRGWHIDAVCDHLEAVVRGDIMDLLINVPPGHMKSMLTCVFLPAWIWRGEKVKETDFLGPSMRFVFASYGYDLAVRDNSFTGALVASDWYQQRWPHVQLVGSNQRRIDTTERGWRLATSIGGEVTGKHSHYQIIDDPLKAGEGASEAARTAAQDFITQTLGTRLLPGGRRIMIMQRLHEDDPSGHALREGGWTHLCLPEEFEPKRKCFVQVTGWGDPRQQEGELLWPEFFTSEAHAKRKKALGSYGTAGQLQQRPAPDEGGVLKRDMFGRYTRATMPTQFDMVFQSWDLTLKGTNDYVAGQVFGASGSNLYLLRRVHSQLTFPQTIAVMKEVINVYPTSSVVIEDAASGAPAKDTLEENGVTSVTLHRPRGDKMMRVHNVVPFLEAKNFHIPDTDLDPGIEDYINELISFPNASHDDQVDATTQAIIWWREHRSDLFTSFKVKGGERESPNIYAR
jgi:predicted phage terminase large subunit-like protein